MREIAFLTAFIVIGIAKSVAIAATAVALIRLPSPPAVGVIKSVIADSRDASTVVTLLIKLYPPFCHFLGRVKDGAFYRQSYPCPRTSSRTRYQDRV